MDPIVKSHAKQLRKQYFSHIFCSAVNVQFRGTSRRDVPMWSLFLLFLVKLYIQKGISLFLPKLVKDKI